MKGLSIHESLFQGQCDLCELSHFVRLMGPGHPDTVALGVIFEHVKWQVHCAVVCVSVQSQKTLKVAQIDNDSEDSETLLYKSETSICL